MTKRFWPGAVVLGACVLAAAWFAMQGSGDDGKPDWAQEALKNGIPPGVTGTLRYHRHVEYPGLKPRDLIVWLPPGYEDHPEKRYGVLYMQDGQNLFDPKTSSFGVDWSVDEAMDRLIRAHEIPPMIVVGIANTPDRTPEYAPGPLGERYMHFVVGFVKPIIDSHYRTLPDREHTLVGGSSSGGLISCMLAWDYPGIFGAALCFSPAFRAVPDWDQMAFFRDKHAPRLPVYLYMDIGTQGLEARLRPGVDDMVALLKADGFKDDVGFTLVTAPGASHNEAAWAKRFPGAIEWAVGKLKPGQP